MVLYSNDCLFPGQGMDFGSKDPRYPHVTIVTRKTHSVEEEVEGWLYVVVDAEEIDEDLARRTIANAIGLPFDEVEIVEA